MKIDLEVVESFFATISERQDLFDAYEKLFEQVRDGYAYSLFVHAMNQQDHEQVPKFLEGMFSGVLLCMVSADPKMKKELVIAMGETVMKKALNKKG